VTRRKALKLILVIAVIAAAIGGWMTLGTGAKTATEERTVTVTRGTIEEVVTAQGKLEPKEYVDVGTQVSGQLKKIHVDIGDEVKSGQLLAEIDPRIYESRYDSTLAQLRSLEAQLAEQQANLVLAKKQHARNAELIRTNAISKDAFDVSAAALKTAEARVGTQQAQMEQTQSTLEGDKTNLEYTKIFAPMDGTVTTLPTREGQTVNASQTAPTLMQLANLNIMTIRAQVAEADVMRLHEGMSVHFTTLGAQEQKWKAVVRQILPSPEIINDVVLYHVLIDVDNKDRQLMNGMSTQIFFELASASDVLLLPVEALGRRAAKEDNEQGLGYMVNRNGEQVLIHIGIMDRANAEVKAGLSENDQVSITPKAAQRSGGGRNMGGPRL